MMTKTRAEILKAMRIRTIHYAWDNPRQDLISKFEKVKKWTGFTSRKLAVYVLTNFNSTHTEDVYRVETLRRIGYEPYVMIYEKGTEPPETTALQRYANNKIIFGSCDSFKDYDKKKG